VALFWPGLAVFRRETTPESRPLRKTVVLTVFTMFMATVLSRPLWALSHSLQATQFPWRWLTLTSIIGPLAAAATTSFWFSLARTKHRPFLLLMIGTVLASVAFSVSHTIREAGYLDQQSFTQTLAGIRGSQGIPYWWPIWAHESPRMMQSKVDASVRAVSVVSWEPESRAFNVSAGEATEARVKTFYYPLWQATVNGRELSTRPDADGALLISLPPDAVSVELNFVEPTRARLARLSTALGWIVLLSLALFGPRFRVGSWSETKTAEVPA
jgi:hypothetical protein